VRVYTRKISVIRKKGSAIGDQETSAGDWEVAAMGGIGKWKLENRKSNRIGRGQGESKVKS
jgi:hypothetical protein